jgi:hypothetical protein
MSVFKLQASMILKEYKYKVVYFYDLMSKIIFLLIFICVGVVYNILLGWAALPLVCIYI